MVCVCLNRDDFRGSNPVLACRGRPLQLIGSVPTRPHQSPGPRTLPNTIGVLCDGRRADQMTCVGLNRDDFWVKTQYHSSNLLFLIETLLSSNTSNVNCSHYATLLLSLWGSCVMATERTRWLIWVSIETISGDRTLSIHAEVALYSSSGRFPHDPTTLLARAPYLPP